MPSKTLNLDGIVTTLDEHVEEYEHLAERAMAYISGLGLELTEQPLGEGGTPLVPKLPQGPSGPTLDILDRRGLSNLLTQFTAYSNYVSTQETHLRVKKAGYEEKLDVVEAELYLTLPPPEASKKARVRTNKQVKKLRFDLSVIQGQLMYISLISKNCEHDKKLVSREVTIREQEFEAERRGESIKRPRKNRSRLPGRPIRASDDEAADAYPADAADG